MSVDLFRQGLPERHQNGGPDDGVEAHDLLAHHVQIGGPIFLVEPVLRAVPERRHIVGERVDPHIRRVFGVEGQRHAPLHRGAGDGEVCKPRLQKVVHHLVDARLGL